jgi:phage shock protein PspC (stress-responsive transcriptional regulator)
MLFVVLLFIAVIAFLIASLVYKRQQRQNGEPLTWAIVTFIVSFAVILGALFVVLVYLVSWENL